MNIKLNHNPEGQNAWNAQTPGNCLEQPRAVGRDGAEEMWDILNANPSRTGTVKPDLLILIFLIVSHGKAAQLPE